MLRPWLFLLFLFLASAASSEVQEPQDFEFRSPGMCSAKEHDPYSGDRLSVTRKGSKVFVNGWVALNCASHIEKPTVAYAPSWVSLSFTEQSASGTYTSCVCANKIEFVLLKKLRPSSRIFLVRQNQVTATAIAP